MRSINLYQLNKVEIKKRSFSGTGRTTYLFTVSFNITDNNDFERMIKIYRFRNNEHQAKRLKELLEDFIGQSLEVEFEQNK